MCTGRFCMSCVLLFLLPAKADPVCQPLPVVFPAFWTSDFWDSEPKARLTAPGETSGPFEIIILNGCHRTGTFTSWMHSSVNSFHFLWKKNIYISERQHCNACSAWSAPRPPHLFSSVTVQLVCALFFYFSFFIYNQKHSKRKAITGDLLFNCVSPSTNGLSPPLNPHSEGFTLWFAGTSVPQAMSSRTWC